MLMNKKVVLEKMIEVYIKKLDYGSHADFKVEVNLIDCFDYIDENSKLSDIIVQIKLKNDISLDTIIEYRLSDFLDSDISLLSDNIYDEIYALYI